MAKIKLTYIYLWKSCLENLVQKYFSYFACMNDFRVYIGTKTGIDKILKTKNGENKSGIYFSNQILNKPKFVNNIKSKCEHFVVLDEELGAAVQI